MPHDLDCPAELNDPASTTWGRRECVVFRKTHELFGDYSNMAPKFPVVVNGVRIKTSEALYQACWHPRRPEMQRTIIEHPNVLIAKRIGKSRAHWCHARPDYESVRVQVMWWVLRVKLACHSKEFGRLLRASKDRAILEESHRDTFWGAVAGDGDTLVGQNVLGRLLMHLRHLVRERSPEEMVAVDPPDIGDFLLYGEPIGRVQGRA